MKTLTKLATVAAFAAFLGTAFADDQQLQNRLAIERAKAAHGHTAQTIAFYAKGRGIGNPQCVAEGRAETRFEVHMNAHGQQFGFFAPAK